jgi:hypothetical protein
VARSGPGDGPIFGPAFLPEYRYLDVRHLADAWYVHGVIALCHSDGNWKKVIAGLVACHVDGPYCLEPNCGMDVVALRNAWTEWVWAGGVALLERGTPAQVKAEVRRHIRDARALETGEMRVASSSETNPPIPPRNSRAMVETVWEERNLAFR